MFTRSSPERRAKVRDEFQRLSADTELQRLSDEELRGFAIRYGIDDDCQYEKGRGNPVATTWINVQCVQRQR